MNINPSTVLVMLRDWQQMTQGQAINWAGMPEGMKALTESKRYRLAADAIEQLLRGAFVCQRCGIRKDSDPETECVV